MLKNIIALLAITLLSFTVGCSQDASISALAGGALSEVVTDENGNVIDEEPIEENEVIDDLVENGEEVVDEEIVDEEVVDEEVVDEEIVDEEVVDEEIVDEPVCSLRKGLRVEKLGDSGILGDISSYKGYLSAAMNYNYYSASAHPIVGPHPEEYEGHFFFYEGKDGLALNFFYNIDAGGSSNNQVKMEVTVKGNNQLDKVLLSDDGNEIKKISNKNNENVYSGKMHYWFNTDGGVIGPLKGEDFKIHVKVFNIGDNKTVGFHSSNGKSLALKTGVSSAEAYSEFVIYYAGEVKDCDSKEIDNSRNKCIKKIADDYEKDIHVAQKWREEYKSALDYRKAKVKELALSQKDDRALILNEFKEILSRMRSDHKESRQELNLDYKSKVKTCNKDKDAKKSGECKKIAASIKADIKLVHSSHKKAYGAVLEQRKLALKAQKDEARAKRKVLASSLLKEAKMLRKELRLSHSKLMESFQKEISSCSIEK